MENEMKVCINLPPLLIVITELSHLPIFPDVRRLSNEEGCWCDERRHARGLAEASVGGNPSRGGVGARGGALGQSGLPRLGPAARLLPSLHPSVRPSLPSGQHRAAPSTPPLPRGATLTPPACSQGHGFGPWAAAGRRSTPARPKAPSGAPWVPRP